MNTFNFFDLNYIWYIIGFLFIPRITMIVVFSIYITNGFVWYNIFLPITIWWKYPLLALGFWKKLAFMIFYTAFPRLLLGIAGYLYFPQNHGAMIVFCIIGFLIDIFMKFIRERLKSKKS
jgi:hypothetical protein